MIYERSKFVVINHTAENTCALFCAAQKCSISLRPIGRRRNPANQRARAKPVSAWCSLSTMYQSYAHLRAVCVWTYMAPGWPCAESEKISISGTGGMCISERFIFNLLRNAAAHLLARIGGEPVAAGARSATLQIAELMLANWLKLTLRACTHARWWAPQGNINRK